MTVKERLIIFIKSLDIGQGAFEKAVGLSNGYVNNIRKSIQPDKLQKIALKFPELNTGWLMTGEGEMLKSPKNPFSQMTPKDIENIATETISAELVKLYKAGEIFSAEVHNRIVGEKDKRIEELLQENWELKKRIEELEKNPPVCTEGD